MIRQAILLALALASPAAAEPLACGEGQIEAVEQVAHYEEDRMPSAPEQPSLISAITIYFGVDGSEYRRERGRRLYPDRDPASDGVAYGWIAYDMEHWLTADHVHYRLRSPDGETWSRRPRFAGPLYPDVAIEDIPPGTPDTAERGGVRCRFRQKTDANGGVSTACWLNVYGREISIDGSRAATAGQSWAKRTISLTRRCIDRSLLEPPPLDWTQDGFIARP